MPVVRLEPGAPFPDPRGAGPLGLVAVGGDLRPESLLEAYSKGIFPWFQRGRVVFWFSPDPRMVLLPRELRVSRSLAKTLRKGIFQVTLDRDFLGVMEGCATVERRHEQGTWITRDMIRAYGRLHDMGYAHSVEAWRNGKLVGGLYGISLGAAFFGESMFARESDASKVAFVHLVRQLDSWGFHIVDCQVPTEHLARFGATEWSRKRFLQALRIALREPTRRGRWAFDPPRAAPLEGAIPVEPAPTPPRRTPPS
jgi:leucyl/phenylalanyl-tRNA--protein transferase